MSAPASRSIAPSSPARGFPWFKWLLAVVILAGLAWLIFFRPAASATAANRRGFGTGPVPVTAEPAKQANLSVRLVALGTVTPVHTVTIRSRVDGELQKIYFEEGSHVEAGAPLADLDPRPFAVQKLQAEAQLAKDTALLENARVDLKRFKTLLEQDSVAEQQVETQAALVRQYEAALKVDQAQVESAALQLSYAHITAPVSGRIGLRTVDQGNIVHAGDATGIAVITQLRPITVLFSIPQDEIEPIMKNLAEGETMEVLAYDRDGRTKLAEGKLVTADNQIDPATGTVKLRAEFANTDEVLFPNQFVNVQLVVDQLEGVTVVPTAAVQRGTIGTYVYVVTEGKAVSLRKIETGATERGVVEITKGLKPGEVVVVDGVDKLKDGTQVELVTRNNGAPAAAKKPHGKNAAGHKPADGAAPAAPAKN